MIILVFLTMYFFNTIPTLAILVDLLNEDFILQWSQFTSSSVSSEIKLSRTVSIVKCCTWMWSVKFNQM